MKDIQSRKWRTQSRLRNIFYASLRAFSEKTNGGKRENLRRGNMRGRVTSQSKYCTTYDSASACHAMDDREKIQIGIAHWRWEMRDTVSLGITKCHGHRFPPL